MSRKSRSRRKAGGSRWLVALVGLFVVLVIAIGVVHTMIRSYLRSDEFRIFLSQKVSAAAGVDGEFKSLEWDGLAVRSDGFEAKGDGPIRKIEVQGLRTDVGLGGFWDGFWELEGFQIRDVDVLIDARSQQASAAGVDEYPRADHAEPQSEQKSGWLPQKVKMQEMKIGRMSVEAMLDSGPLSMKGMRVDVAPSAGHQSYEVKVTGGKIELPDSGIPQIELDEADMRYKDGAMFLNHAEARFGQRSRIELAGEWDPALDIRSAHGSITGVDCSEWLADNWVKHVRGDLSAEFEVIWVSGEPMANGHLELKNGVITSLPILDILGAYLDTSRFRMLTLNEAHCNWSWRKGQWSINNLVVRSEGLLRLEGGMRVIGEDLDGNFRLGVAPGTLASIPGAEEHVFLPGEMGLRWAPVRVTGTLSKPKQDLADRLYAAAGRRLIESLPEATLKTLLVGKDVIDVSTQRAVQEGVRLLEGGSDLLDYISRGVLPPGLDDPDEDEEEEKEGLGDVLYDALFGDP